MLYTIIIIVLILLLIGALPHWGYASRYNYGYFPAGGIGLLLVILLVLFLLGVLR